MEIDAFIRLPNAKFTFDENIVEEGYQLVFFYSAALDLWAREHGYEKIELNLVGL